MSTWIENLTPTEATQLAEWESEARTYKDRAAMCATWKRRLASKVRARMKAAENAR